MYLTATKNPMILEELETPDTYVCTLSPNDRRNIYYMAEPKEGSLTINLNSSDCLFGDELIVMLSRPEETILSITFSDDFIITFCSSVQEMPIENIDTSEWMAQFFFDGEKFLCTFDLG